MAPFQSDRPKFKVNLPCSKCGATILELPFEPKSDRPVTCSNCHRAEKQQGGGQRSF